MENIEITCERLKFTMDYLKDVDYELWERLSNYMLNGIGEEEILLETAVKVGLNRNMIDSALLMVSIYERGKNYCYPLIAHAVRNEILRNTVLDEKNVCQKCLYAAEMNNGTVKIGISANTDRRLSQIKASSGMNIERVVYTEAFQDAFKEEQRLHRKFKGRRLNGEYFSVPFETVRKEIENLARDRNINATNK